MSRSLFEDQESSTPQAGRRAPLADRVRPATLEEIVGQDELVGASGFLRRAIEEGRVPSLIFWGPPGSGKTTLARIIAEQISCRFVPFSAVTSGIKEVKQVMAEASVLFRDPERRTLLFVDEIHRFNRAQQDAFLPYVERGDIVLIGATTENPSFALNAALLSPSGVELSAEARQQLVQLASGDARKALNLLELAVEDAAAGGLAEVSAERVTRLAQKKVLLYDKSGEEHFNLISALHKSLRESDPDAALYWLARMLEAGEDPLYVARRMARFASEDVGLADPQALPQTLAAWDTYHRLGSPEGELALAQAALYLALAPKSNAVYRAYSRVRRTLAEQPADPVPHALRNAPTRLMEEVGYGDGYVYAHDTEEGVGGLDCLPESLQGTRFYEPRGEGFEEELAQRLERFRELRAKARQSEQRE
jgi:putative ATPase